MFPGRPDDARNLVGERHGSLVVPAAPLGFECTGGLSATIELSEVQQWQRPRPSLGAMTGF
jgi:hypothetical protein